MSASHTDLDSPWKDVLEVYFTDFMQFFFPAVYELIDWTQPYEFLDKEFQAIAQQAASGCKIVDKLVKVHQRNGQITHIYIHIEVQTHYDKQFAERMFVYFYRIFDTFQQPVISLAILGDANAQWRPDSYQQTLGGCSVNFTFPTVKLLHYQADWAALCASRNPFSIIVRTHLKALETRQHPEQRLHWKMQLFRALYEEDYVKQDIIYLFRFLDWVMQLPEALNQKFDDMARSYSEDKQMPVLSRIEVKAQEKGRLLGLEEGEIRGVKIMLIKRLSRQLTSIPTDISEQLNNLTDLQQIYEIDEQIPELETLEQLRQLLDSFSQRNN